MNEFDMYQDALRLCERGEMARSRAVADAYFMKAIRLLEELVQLVPDSNRFHQLLAICWYNLSEKSAERSRAIEDHLCRAWAIKPGEQLTLAHQIYYHYEQAQYQQALELLDQVNYDYFESAGQRWRNLKYDELRLCCRLHLTPASVTEGEVRDFFVACDALEDADRHLPTELQECTTELATRLALCPQGKGVLAGLKSGFGER